MAKAFDDGVRFKANNRTRHESGTVRNFESKHLPVDPDAVAPDGAVVRLLAALDGGSFAHFEFPAHSISMAVKHRTVEEIWFVQSGEGRIWRKSVDQESIIDVGVGDCLTIPLGTAFQYRSVGSAPLSFVAVTMPPWPGAGEAIFVEGPWRAGVAKE